MGSWGIVFPYYFCPLVLLILGISISFYSLWVTVFNLNRASFRTIYIIIYVLNNWFFVALLWNPAFVTERLGIWNLAFIIPVFVLYFLDEMSISFSFRLVKSIVENKWENPVGCVCYLVSKLKSWELLKMDFWRVVFPHFFSLLAFFINFFRISIAFCSLQDIAFNFKHWIIFIWFNPISIYLLFYLWRF